MVAKLIAGNWKMNGSVAQASALVQALDARLAEAPLPADVVICPPFQLLPICRSYMQQSALQLGGQDCHYESSGPFTGDISASMLKDIGCSHVILGHSERRQGHRENDTLICSKAIAAHKVGLKTIICVGESLEEREEGAAGEVVRLQMDYALPEALTPDNAVIAYEPVWAIGTGKTATADEIASMHSFMRQSLVSRYGEMMTEMPILYGGSVKPENASEIMGIQDVNGVLVGGASLTAESFWAICQAAKNAA